MKKLVLSVALAGLVLAACNKGDKMEAAGGELSLNAGVNAIVDTVTLPQIISANRTLTADTLYRIDGKVFVTGGTLSILPGTRVEGVYKSTPEAASALVITKTGKISAKGQQSNPIIFTSSVEGLPGGRTNRLPGDWGGIVILGNAPTNKPTTQFIEGINPASVPPGVDVTYGGSDPDHNGGVLQFAQINFAGAAIAANNELNSLTLGGVGKKTGIQYLQLSYGQDDALEIFGGTVFAKYIIANSQNDDAFDFDFGYVGDIQFGISVRNAAYAYADANGIECDNDGTGSTATPRTRPVLSNFTFVGQSSALPGTLNGARFRRGTDLRMRNSILLGYNNGVAFENTNPTNAAAFFRNNGVHGFVTSSTFVGTSVGPVGLGNLELASATAPSTTWVNNAFITPHSSYKSSALVYRAGGPFDPATVGGVDTAFNGLTTNFLRVPYVGALGPGSPIRDGAGKIVIPNNWVAGTGITWTDFNPQ